MQEYKINTIKKKGGGKLFSAAWWIKLGRFFQIAAERIYKCIRIFIHFVNENILIFYSSRLAGLFLFVLYFSTGSFLKLWSLPVPTGFYVLSREGMKGLVTGGGIAGAFSSVLLQSLKDKECGIELSDMFRFQHKYYIQNFVFFIISTTLSVYYAYASDFDLMGRYLVLCTNSIGMALELIYILSMCWDFLFSQTTRKKNAYVFLEKHILAVWSKTEYEMWNTRETRQLIRDFSFCANWKDNSAVQWFFEQWFVRFGKLEHKNNQPERWIKDTEKLLMCLGKAMDCCPVSDVMGGAIAAYVRSYMEAETSFAKTMKDFQHAANETYDLEGDTEPAQGSEMQSRRIERRLAKKLNRRRVSDEPKPALTPGKFREAFAYLLAVWAVCLFHNSEETEHANRVNEVFDEFYNAMIHAVNLLDISGQEEIEIEKKIIGLVLSVCALALYINQGETLAYKDRIKMMLRRYEDYLRGQKGIVYSREYINEDLFNAVMTAVNNCHNRPGGMNYEVFKDSAKIIDDMFLF